MSAMDWLRVAAVIGPIVALLFVGFWLTLRSGIVGLPTGQSVGRLASNVSSTTFLVVGCLVALVFVQRIVGFHLALAW